MAAILENTGIRWKFRHLKVVIMFRGVFTNYYYKCQGALECK